MSADNINKLTIVLEGDSKKLQAALNAANNAMKGFDSKAKKMGSSSGGLGGILATAKKLVPAMGAAFAVDAIKDFTIQAVRLASKLEGIERNFKLISSSGAISMNTLRSSTMGAVSDFDLMQKAVQANNFKLPLENLGKFFEFATIRAQQTGESVNWLTQSIVLGIGRKSPLILDNLGITLVRLKEAMGKVGRESATVAEISQAVAKIAEEETEMMKALGFTTKTAGQEFDTLTASFVNFKTEFGKRFLDSATGQVKGLALALQGAAEIMAQGEDSLTVINSFFGLLGGDNTHLERLEKIRAKVAELDRYNAMMGASAKEALENYFEGEFGEITSSKLRDIRDRLFPDVDSASPSMLTTIFGTAAEMETYKEQFLNILKEVEAKERQMADDAMKLGERQFEQLKVRLKLEEDEFDKQLALIEAITQAELARNRTQMEAAEERLSKIDQNKYSLEDIAQIEEWRERLLERILQQYKKIAEVSKDVVPPEVPDDLTLPIKTIEKDDPLSGLRELSTMMSQLSTAFGQISQLFGGADSGIGRFVAGFTKVVTVVAAAVGAMAAFRTLSGDLGAAAVAVGVATGVAGVISGIAGVSAGGNNNTGGFNVGSLDGQSLHTEISGRNLKIVLDRENGFSSRRGG